MLISPTPVSIPTGLTDAEVTRLRAAGKGNNVRLPSSRSYWEICKENLFTFINAVFFSLGLIMTILGRYGDALLVVVIVFGGVLVNLYQEIWAKRQLDHIALLHRPQVTVVRSGQHHSVDPSEVVLGDVLLVQSGDQILVDGVIVGDGRVDVDESLLTGESDLIVKVAGDQLYSGTICVSGSACFEAHQVGSDTTAYKLTTGARAFRHVYTPLQRETNLVVRIFLLLACFLLILVWIGFLSRTQTFADTIQRAAVVAGLVPTGLLLAIILAYGLGAIRMLGQDVLIQQANAVESLSNVDILCLDKTGTLTSNLIHLQALFPCPLPGQELSEAQLRQWLGDFTANLSTHTRTSEALQEACPGSWIPVNREIPFSSARQWSALSFAANSPELPASLDHKLDRNLDRGDAIKTPPGTYVLGAPEQLGSLDRPDIQEWIQTGLKQGWRVLMFAWNPDPTSLEDRLDPPRLPDNLVPVGILYFRDELRPQVRQTLQQFGQAGIQLKIISGDNPQTVATVAQQAGLGSQLPMISGLDLVGLDEAQFAQAALKYTILGRITPEQKARLVKALRDQGHYIAMIGDGVNDVLSLKQANLGIAMESGSKATRAVADIVLLKDSFGSLPHAFLEGQRIRNGIRDVLTLYIVRVFCVTLIIFATAMVTDTFPLVNKHSALIALIGVGLPTLVLPIWAKPGVRQRRSMIRSLLHFTIPAALSITLTALVIYLLYVVAAILDLDPGSGLTQVDYSQPRTALVSMVVFCQLFLLVFLKPPTNAWVGGEPLSQDWRYTLTAALLGCGYLGILSIPPLRSFFELSSLSELDILFLILVALQWCFIQRALWRSRFLDRFLGVQLR